jgi:hypothetical protein
MSELLDHAEDLLEQCEWLFVTLEDVKPGHLDDDLLARVDGEVCDLGQRVTLLCQEVERAVVAAESKRHPGRAPVRGKARRVPKPAVVHDGVGGGEV